MDQGAVFYAVEVSTMHMEVLLKKAILDDCAPRVGELLPDTAVIRNRYVPLQHPGEHFVINLQCLDRWRISSAALLEEWRQERFDIDLVPSKLS